MYIINILFYYLLFVKCFVNKSIKVSKNTKNFVTNKISITKNIKYKKLY